MKSKLILFLILFLSGTSNTRFSLIIFGESITLQVNMTKSAQDQVTAAQAVRDTDFPSAVRTKTGEALENMLEQFEATGFPGNVTVSFC